MEWAIVIITVLTAVAICVAIQVEAIVWIRRKEARNGEGEGGRKCLSRNLYVLLLAHFLHFNIFALAFLVLDHLSIGTFSGIPLNPNFSEYLYYSAISYTTIGFGDIIPIGPMRTVTAACALTGLILIAVSATHLVISYDKYLKRHDRRD